MCGTLGVFLFRPACHTFYWELDALRLEYFFLMLWIMNWVIFSGSEKRELIMYILYVQVEKGAKVDLPFWLAHGMLSLEQAVSINVPPCFTQK